MNHNDFPNRNDLPTEADNYDVFCERCQRIHRHYFFTQEDHDRLIADGAKTLAEAIDTKVMEQVYSDLYKTK